MCHPIQWEGIFITTPPKIRQELINFHGKKKDNDSLTTLIQYDTISVRKLSVFEYAVFECRKKVCLFRRLSVQPSMVLVAGLDGRLSTLFSLWLGSVIDRATLVAGLDGRLLTPFSLWLGSVVDRAT